MVQVEETRERGRSWNNTVGTLLMRLMQDRCGGEKIYIKIRQEKQEGSREKCKDTTNKKKPQKTQQEETETTGAWQLDPNTTFRWAWRWPDSSLRVYSNCSGQQKVLYVHRTDAAKPGKPGIYEKKKHPIFSNKKVPRGWGGDDKFGKYELDLFLPDMNVDVPSCLRLVCSDDDDDLCSS